jgi:hypothetical protein
MRLEDVLNLCASVFIGKEAEIAVAERLIRREKHAEFLHDCGKTFREQTGRHEAGGHGKGTVVGDDTQVQGLNLVFRDIVKESGEMRKENADVVVVGTGLLAKRDAWYLGRVHVEVADGCLHCILHLKIAHCFAYRFSLIAFRFSLCFSLIAYNPDSINFLIKTMLHVSIHEPLCDCTRLWSAAH